MTSAAAALAVVLAAFAALPAGAAEGAAPLAVCLDASSRPAVVGRETQGDGFEAAVVDAVARRLGRPAILHWFKTEADPDSSTMLTADALLSAGACRLVGDYPLVASALGKPGMQVGGFPGYAGAKPDRRRAIALGTLVPSRAYRFSTLTIVLGGGAAARHITGLADLQGLRLGVEGGTLADAVLMLFGNGRLVDRITHVVAGRGELLSRLEQGDFEAVLVEMQRFDAYRAGHPATKLTASGYYSPIGFNMGFVALSTEGDLIAKVDGALATLQQSGALGQLARAAGVTWLPPREPNISAEPTMADLRRN